MEASISLQNVLESMRRWSWRTRAHLLVLLLATGLALAHQLVYFEWYIEDAAISFGYAQNLVDGHGLVPYPGGERIEGYSNPTWVALLALFELVRVDGFTSSKILGGLFGCLTVPLVYGIVRLGRARQDEIALIAPLALALFSPFAIWCASGLENSLFSLLLAAGIYRTLRESDGERRWPLAALLFMLLAITRPEGILYAAIGGFFAMVFALADGRGLRPTGRWLIAFFGPFLAYHAARYAYFAWPWPNTYYAKVVESPPRLEDWSGRGWRYLRRAASLVGIEKKEPGLGLVYGMPIYVWAVTGLRRWRGLLALLLMLLAAGLYLFPPPLDVESVGWWPAWDPGKWLADQELIKRARNYEDVRAWFSMGLALLLPVIGMGRRSWRAPVLSWTMLCAALFFMVYSNGDWMKGYRWVSLAAVPLVVLLALGCGNLADAADALVRALRSRADAARGLGPVGAGLALLVGALMLLPNYEHYGWYTRHRETSPYSVKKRVNYMRYVQRRLHLEHVTLMDVDMGAHLFWTDWYIADMAGLVDVPIGHHQYQKPFMREYVFDERRPDFAHVHGGWASRTKIPQLPPWRKQYVEIPGYPSSRKHLHVGNHVRRDLLVGGPLGGSGPVLRMERGVQLEGVELPLPTATPGAHLHVRVGLSVHPPSPDPEAAERRPRRARPDFDEEDRISVLLFLARGQEVAHSWTVEPGYDWLPPSEWEAGEVVVGSYDLILPEGLEQRAFDLGLVLIGPEGRVLQPLAPEQLPAGLELGAAEGDGPVYAAGELRLPSAVRLVSSDAVAEQAQDLLDAVLERAESADCEGAERGWELVKRRMARRFYWQDNHRPWASRAIASCWARRAGQSADRATAVDQLARAWRWDSQAPIQHEVAGPLADELVEEGRIAAEAARGLLAAWMGRCEEAAERVAEARARAAGSQSWTDQAGERLEAEVQACEPGEEPPLDEERPELVQHAWEASYAALSDALRIDASRAWARRWAEEARDHRLGLDPLTLEREEAQKQARREEARIRAEERRRKRAEQQEQGRRPGPHPGLPAVPETLPGRAGKRPPGLPPAPPRSQEAEVRPEPAPEAAPEPEQP